MGSNVYVPSFFTALGAGVTSALKSPFLRARRSTSGGGSLVLPTLSRRRLAAITAAGLAALRRACVFVAARIVPLIVRAGGKRNRERPLRVRRSLRSTRMPYSTNSQFLMPKAAYSSLVSVSQQR